MKSDRLLLWLLLSAGVAVTLGMTLATLPAQDMPPLLPAPAAQQPTRQSSPVAAAAKPAAPSAAAPQTLAQISPPSAPANPPPATVPAAQTPPAAPTTPPTAAAEPQAPPPPPSATPSSPKLTQAELGQLLAPIALYPDQLLSQILMASTHPDEIVAAAHWVADPAHRALRGAALSYALRDQHWDPSVIALVAFPHVLELMCGQLEWTQKLGAAFLAQQAELMDEVQQLRLQAVAAGNFKSGPRCQCVVAQSGGVVTVAPVNPRVVYVPVYTPAIYGAWLYPAYPPFLFPLPVGFAFAPGYFIGFGFGVNVAYYGPLWGWGGFSWGGHHVIVDPVRYGAISRWHSRVGSAAWSGGHAGHAAWGGGHAGHFAWGGGRGGAYAGGRGMHMAAGGGWGHGGGRGERR